jgi:NAD(P)-dependent dehydrogenase (short-subunit alcohol dehydrogenase family)
MRALGYGRFVFTSSGAGVFGGFHEAPYMAAKAGLLGVNNAVAIEGAPFGIRSNCVLPIAYTRMADPGSDPIHFRTEDAALMTGAERLGDMRPEFVTPLVVYLASEACSVTQQVFSAVVSRYARVFVGATLGWYGPTDTPATAEDINDHLDEISDRTTYFIPTSVFHEGALVIEHVPR